MVIRQRAFGCDLVIIGQVDQTYVHVGVDDVDGTVITLDWIKRSQFGDRLGQNQRSRSTLGLVFEINGFPRKGTGLRETDGIFVQDILVERLALQGDVQWCDISFVCYKTLFQLFVSFNSVFWRLRSRWSISLSTSSSDRML